MGGIARGCGVVAAGRLAVGRCGGLFRLAGRLLGVWPGWVMLTGRGLSPGRSTAKGGHLAWGTGQGPPAAFRGPCHGPLLGSVACALIASVQRSAVVRP